MYIVYDSPLNLFDFKQILLLTLPTTWVRFLQVIRISEYCKHALWFRYVDKSIIYKQTIIIDFLNVIRIVAIMKLVVCNFSQLY